MAERHTGKRARYQIVEENRIGDHICYYSDLRKMRAHYPEWDVRISLDETIRQIAESWYRRTAT